MSYPKKIAAKPKKYARLTSIPEIPSVHDGVSEEHRIAIAIKHLRAKRGLMQNELALRANLAPSQICSCEKGERIPSFRTLRKICTALGTTIEDLLRAAMGVDGVDGIAHKNSGSSNILPGMQEMFLSPEEQVFKPLMAKGYIRTTQSDSFQAPLPDEDSVRSIERRLDDYRRIETLCGAFRETSIPLSIPFRTTPEGAEQLATQVRAALGLGDSIVHDYVSILESHGVRIVFMELPRGIESLAFFDANHQSIFIVVSDSATTEKQLFRIALELAYAYLFTKNSRSPVLESAEANRRFAKLFAACFLMPSAAVLSCAASLGAGRGDWTYPLVLRVKRHFGVSAELFCYRLFELGLVDQNSSSGMIATIKSHYAKFGHCEPGIAMPELIKNGRLADLVERARGMSDSYDEAKGIAQRASVPFGV